MHGWSKGGIMMIMTEGESGRAGALSKEKVKLMSDFEFTSAGQFLSKDFTAYYSSYSCRISNESSISGTKAWESKCDGETGWSRWSRLSCMDGWVHRWVKGERWNWRNIVGTSEEINERRKKEERAMMKLWGTKTDEWIMMLGCRRWKCAVDYD